MRISEICMNLRKGHPSSEGGSGGGASDSTMLRALDELAERVGGDGLPGRRLARATAAARATAWAAIVARHGRLPAVSARDSREFSRTEGSSG